MDQNQGADNDLQKAIDNINAPTTPEPADANTNINNSDPIFSDPVAAPSSIPEGDTGELGEPVGPFPMPPADPPAEPKVGIVTPGPEPIAPLDPITIPDLGVPTETSAPANQDQPGPEPLAPAEPAAPAPENDSNKPHVEPKSSDSDSLEHAIKTGEEKHTEAANTMSARQIKTAALRDLAPLLNHIRTAPEEKFKICCSIFEDLHDYSVLDQAYKAASEIKNDDERAQSLLYLIESIDGM